CKGVAPKRTFGEIADWVPLSKTDAEAKIDELTRHWVRGRWEDIVSIFHHHNTFHHLVFPA
ncbi:hypothetical protein NBRC10512_003058, partial [Rhodotorula toruloides]